MSIPSKLDPDERQAYEVFLLTGDLNTALAKLVSGTPAYLYLQSLEKLGRYPDLSVDEKKQIGDFARKGKYHETHHARKIDIRLKLLEVSDATKRDKDCPM